MIEYKNISCSKVHAGYKCLHIKGQNRSFFSESSDDTLISELPDHSNHFSTSSHKSQTLNEKISERSC